MRVLPLLTAVALGIGFTVPAWAADGHSAQLGLRGLQAQSNVGSLLQQAVYHPDYGAEVTSVGHRHGPGCDCASCRSHHRGGPGYRGPVYGYPWAVIPFPGHPPVVHPPIHSYRYHSYYPGYHHRKPHHRRYDDHGGFRIVTPRFGFGIHW